MAAAAAEAHRPRAQEPPSPSQIDQGSRLRRRGRRLEVITSAWNVGEVVATLALGFLANSLALVAFGLDSLVEVFASLVVIWHLGAPLGASGRRAQRLVAGAFGVLGLYLAAAGTRGIVSGSHPARSPAGIAVLALTVVAMVCLARAKRRVGLAISSPPLLANATMTLLDAALASGVLLALVLDLVVGWWWADPAAALVVAVVAWREGMEGWREAR
jgi:divalent metal cation (Fe/Co/Zn/Cd) transporter